MDADGATTFGPMVHQFGHRRPDEWDIPFTTWTILRATDFEGREHIFEVPSDALAAPAVCGVVQRGMNGLTGATCVLSSGHTGTHDYAPAVTETADLLDTRYHRRRVARRRAGRNTAWLIERGQPEGFSQPVWYGSYAAGGKWTTDANEAVRFTSKDDAEMFIERHLTPVGIAARATEHGWVAAGTYGVPLTTEEEAEARQWVESRRGKPGSRGMLLAIRLLATLDRARLAHPAVTETDLRAEALEAFIECHDRAYWHDSNRTHTREWPGCPDPECVARAALAGTSDR